MSKLKQERLSNDRFSLRESANKEFVDTLKRPRRGTRVLKFPGDPSKTKYYTWAAAVFNDKSSEKTLELIGANLGIITQKNKRIRNVETPLLGTGAGKMTNEQSAKCLARGFSQTSHDDSALHIFAWDHERFMTLSSVLSKDNWDEVWEEITVRQDVFCITLDQKKMLLTTAEE